MQLKLILAATLVVVAASSARADLVVSEIMYNPASTADGDWEYIEIYNNGNSAIDFSATGWFLDDDDGTALSSANIVSGAIGSNAFAVLYNADDNSAAAMESAWNADGSHSGINWIGVTNFSSFGNGGDFVGLWDSLANYDNQNTANAHDGVLYDDDGTNWPSDNGFASIYFTGALDAGSDPRSNNDFGSNWALSVDGVEFAYASAPAGSNGGINIGSPGNISAVPEPGSLVMSGILLIGGIVVARQRRQKTK